MTMTKPLQELGGTGRFARGLHPPDRKQASRDAAIEVLAPLQEVRVPLLQHTGAPCQSRVKPKQEVQAGEIIGDTEAFISAPVHSPVPGIVQRGTVTTLPNGRHVPVIPIAPADHALRGDELKEDIFGGAWPAFDADRHTPEAIVTAARAAGLVGMGGAAFPTSVKLTRQKDKPIDVLLVNGCECEPYLTSDHRLMVEAPRPVLRGAQLAAHACGAQRVVIAVEDNKPDAADVLRRAADGTPVQVVLVKTRYPMGGERQVIPAVLGREVPTGKLPLDVGVVVVNVATAAALARAVLRGQALTHRIVSVTGEGVARPANILAPVGAPIRALLEHCGGLTPEAQRVLVGGPMMGFAITDYEIPVTKGTSGIVVLTGRELACDPETACVRCGRCVDVCPLNLVPSKTAHAARHRDWDLARRYHLAACCECGCCAYVCPAHIPLVQLMRMGKALMPRS